MKFSFKNLFVSIFLFGVVAVAHATPEAPVLNCEGPGCTGYDLSAYNIPFSYSWPSEPQIASEATVTPATLATNNVSGRRLILTPGNYGDVTSRDDQEWILQEGALINGFDFSRSSRIKVRGESPRVGRIGYLIGAPNGGASDILFDGIYQSSGTWSTPTTSSNGPGGVRVAIINSSLNCASYCLFIATERTNAINNIIIAGNYIRTDNIPINGSVAPQHLVRIMSINTFIFVGNYMVKTNTGMVFRIHTNSVSPAIDTFDGYVADNVLLASYSERSYNALQVYPASNAYTPGYIYDLTFENNEIYNPVDSIVALDNTTWSAYIRNLTLLNNNGYGHGQWPSTSSWPTFVSSGNNAQPFDQRVVPTPASKLGWSP